MSQLELWRQKVFDHYLHAQSVYGKDNVWATMLYGSQNYDMATSESDVDVKTMLFPTVRDTVLGFKTDSTDLVLFDGSLNGVKDYRDTFSLYLRGNVRYLETIYSKVVMVNSDYQSFFTQLSLNRELIANSLPRRLMHSVYGMAEQKYKALEHPYPSKLEILKKYGYDPKQLHHLVRLHYFMVTYMETMSYEKSLWPAADTKEYLFDLKINPIPLDAAQDLAVFTRLEMTKLLAKVDDGALPDEYKYEEAKEFLNQLALDLFKARYNISEEGKQ